jgi:hypothetical protein
MANVEEGLRMVGAFTSVGMTHFGLSVIDDVGDRHVAGRQLTHAHKNEIRFRLPKILTEADEQHWSVIIRPEPLAGMMLAQLDDLDAARVEILKRYALVAVCTSLANYQAWIVLVGEPNKEDARDFALRLNRGVGADHRASRAGRIAGSVNYKQRHGPRFPPVEIVYVHNGYTVTRADLESAGLVAPPAPKPALSVSPWPAPTGLWPTYAWVLSRAPMRQDGSGRDRSTADAFFCKLAAVRGHSVDAIAAELLRVSAKAQEEIARGRLNYALDKAQWGATAAGSPPLD